MGKPFAWMALAGLPAFMAFTLEFSSGYARELMNENDDLQENVISDQGAAAAAENRISDQPPGQQDAEVWRGGPANVDRFELLEDLKQKMLISEAEYQSKR